MRTRRSRFYFLFLFVLSSAVSAQPDLSGFTTLPGEDHDIIRRALALRSPENLPPAWNLAEGDYHEHAFCGTLEALKVRSEISTASKPTQASLAFLFQQPRTAFSTLSPSGSFLIHYDRTGRHAVDPTDSDQNGVPDYVDAVAEVFDDVWEHQVDQLGYLEPPSDSDGLYDVYLRDLSATAQFGITFPQTDGITSPSYIEIENNFTDPIYTTQGLEALRFTAAHEFFHAVQFRYFLSIEAAWWYELTATWMQDEIFTDVNDHYVLVDGYLSFPEAAMYEPPPVSLRPYGAMIMGVHLTKVYGETTIRETLEDLGNRLPNPYTIEDADFGLPGGFAGVLPRYFIWNYFTGSRAHGERYYPEASAYQDVSETAVTPIGSLTLGGATQVQSLGATYARINTTGKSGGLEVSFTLQPGPQWNLDVLLVRSGNVDVIRPSGTVVRIPDAGDYDAIVFVPSIISVEGAVYDLSYTVRMDASITQWSDLLGDMNGDGSVAFEDFVTFADSFGKPATETSVHSDFNADGSVDFTDFLVFVRQFGETR